MKEAFRHFNFKSNTLKVIDLCNSIIEGYQAKGYDLTLRQLYYQLVARDLIPNKSTEYDKLGDVVSNARLAGLIDWEAIVDRTRGLRGTVHKDNPEAAIASAARGYRRDKWTDQPNRVEIWVEKEALAGIFSRVAARNDIDYFSCRGYASQTAMYDAAKRFAHYRDMGQETVILHFGDHDPSGIDMTRDIRERIEMFLYDEGIEVNRLALNMDQVRRYNPPPNPAKESDSRSGQYVKLYGSSSWELDALDPDTLANLVDEAIKDFRDEDLWEAAVAKETEERASLGVISAEYQDIAQRPKDEGKITITDEEEDYDA